MADYGAWAGLGNALGGAGDAFIAARKARVEAALKKGEADKNAAMTDFYKSKTGYMFGDPDAPPIGPQTAPISGAPSTAMPPAPRVLPPAMQDKLALQQDKEKASKERDKYKASLKPAGQGLSRGEASLVGKYFSGADSQRLSSVPNATSLHNALVDLHQAYTEAHHGDPGRAMSMLKQKAAGNDFLRTQLGGIGNNPENIVPVYAAARRAAATELFKIVNGSSATPTEDAIAHNASQYPDLGMPLQQAQSLFNLTKDTQILPAIRGLRKKVELNRDPKTGKYSSAELEKLSRTLGAMEEEVSGSVHNLKGGVADKIIPNEAGPVAPPPPPIGFIKKGHRYKGGDPADPSNWQKVQ